MLKAICSLFFIIIGGFVMGFLYLRDSDKTTAYRKANTIYYEGKRLAEGLFIELQENYSIYLSFDNLLYEMVFFLYCLEVVKLINDNNDTNICKYIGNYIFSKFNELEELHFAQNKIAVTELFNQRKSYYLSMFKTYDLKLNSKLIKAAFDYQAKVLSVTQKDTVKTESTILSLLEDYLEYIKTFCNQYI